ncbi:MAG: hypothetical protein KGL95_08845 [Patescibacteria group bacterium]|nr:hypothetical protein [Patescibacteria group bacterium]
MPGGVFGANPPIQQTPAAGVKPWWMFGICSGYSGQEPYGGGPKPDINICIPQANYPITALGSGYVTNIDKVSPWGYAVTVKLDTPHNAVATHDAYLHLASIDPSLYVGAHVQPGSMIGTGGNNQTGSGKQPAGVGYAWYNGDQYGYGSTWNQYVGSANLNPTSFFNNVTNNPAIPYSNAATQAGANSYTQGSGCDTPIVGPLICFIQKSALVVGFFLLGLVLIIIGFVILIHPDPSTLIKGAALA